MVGDQEAADTRLDRPRDVLDRVGELAHAPKLAEVGGPVGRARMRADTQPSRGPTKSDTSTPAALPSAASSRSSASLSSIAPLPCETRLTTTS